MTFTNTIEWENFTNIFLIYLEDALIKIKNYTRMDQFKVFKY